MTNIAVDPQTPSRLYVTTLTSIFRSTNGGNSWSPAAGIQGSNPRIAIDPKTPSTVYVATARGEMSEASETGRGNPRKRAAQFFTLEGVSRSTDSGASWDLVNAGLPDTLFPYALVIDAVDTSTIYLGAANGLYKSTDRGNSWSRVDFFVSPTALAISPAADRSLFAANRAGGAATDAFVSKLNPQGTALLYSTLLGGLLFDAGSAITLDAAGNSFVTGYTASKDFPVTAAASQRTLAGSLDVFVAKLSATGAVLDYSSFLGGSGTESPSGIALDAAGNIFVAGYTNSKNFPTANAIQTGLSNTPSARGSFIAKINLSIKAPKGPTIMGVSLKGKKLVVSGEGFGAGSVILIDGEEQVTANDDGNPGSKLISKAAKKITPGRTVMISVRNPDGTTSNEYSFARPVE